tara:strand:+ start:332263 stop:334233 length:1971 start_codon:yes stop_codon:yes gene_type:complete
MSWVSALSPWQWAVMGSVPLGIILLYFLKLRREPVEVPSTYLWMRTIEDLHVNSLLQRLRRSLLLFLQLLAVVMAALALLRPGIRGESSGQGRMVFLLDTSASMQATDVDDDSNRFEKARRLIGDQIDAMTDSDTAMLVTFSDRAEVLQSFTSDRRRLRDALGRAQVTNRSTDVLGALRAADGLANPRRSSQVGDVNDVQVADAMPADLMLYSDGGFQTVTEFNLGNLIPQYFAIGSDQPSNVGITAFSAERNVEQPSEVQAFATVVNTGATMVEATASLFLGDELIDASAVTLEPGEQTGLSFTLDAEDAVSLRLMLDIDDDLALDNVAFAGLTPLRTVSVLVVTPGNAPLELGLTTEKAAKICIAEFVSPSYLESDEYRKRSAAAVDDLMIFDRCSPKEMPPTNTFFIGDLPTQGWKWATDPGQVVLIDLDRTHPIMRYLELFSLLIFSGRAVEGPPGTTELAGADIGSVLSIAPRDGYQDLVLGFEVISSDEDGNSQTNTNWYAERSWPVFILNVLRHLAGAAEASGAPSYRPGETVRLRLESAIDQVEVKRISGNTETQVAGPSGIIEIVSTDETGNYQVENNDRLVDLFAINLFDARESELSVAPAVEMGYEEVTATLSGIEDRHEYWRWLLVAMLGLLATEWWVYSKRVA